MKQLLAVLIAAFTLFVIGQASATSTRFTGQSLDSLSSPSICAEEKKKKKNEEAEEDEEPECD